MKIRFSLIFCLLTSLLSAQDYLDKMTQQTCECVKTLNDTMDEQRMYMELGVCMLKTAEPYKKQLKKDYGINVDNLDQEGEALGKLIGLRMATMCPDALLRITEKASKKNKDATSDSFTGRVTKIEKDFFVIFTVNYEGKSLKFYWLTFAESNIELIEQYTQLFDKDVKVEYTVRSLFDPKIGDYRNFNVIDKIEKMSR